MSSPFLDDPLTLIPGRRATFANWPYTGSTDRCTPKALANAGFIYRPDLANDATQCFVCHKVLSNWNPKDDPMAEHRTINPECAFVLLTNVGGYEESPRVAVMEAECARFCAKFKYRFLTEVEAPRRKSYRTELERLEQGIIAFMSDNNIILPARSATTAAVRRTRRATARKRILH